jgi:hypothetical protein
MPTEEELHEKYSQTATTDLLEIVNKKSDYTELAISVAHKELKARKVSAHEIKDYKSFEDPYKELWLKNCLFDLNFPQKAASYFLGMFNYFLGLIVKRLTVGIRTGPLYSPNFKAKGYLLKANQYNYYSVSGFSFFVIALIASQFSGSIFLIVWIAGFLISYLFDIGYNKQRQTDKLHKIMDKGELSWGY